MRALTPTLAAAQRQPVREAVVVARVVDAPIEWPRWDWQPIYRGAEPDGAHGLVQLASGRLLRARQAPDGALFIQRIDDPTDAGQWQSWTELVAAGGSDVAAGLALAAQDDADRARLFHVAADGATIRCRETTDGVVWSDEVVAIEPAPRRVTALAADLAGGDEHLIYGLDLGLGGADEVLVAIERVGGAWINRVEQGQLRDPIAGLAAAHDVALGRLAVVVADGSDPPGSGGRRLVLQDYDLGGGAWTGATVLHAVAPAAGYDLRAPRLRLAGPGFPRHLYCFVERSGAPPGDRVVLAVTPERGVLTEMLPWDATSAHGLAPLRTAAGWLLSGANRADCSPLEVGGAGQIVDISADVLALEVVEPGLERPAQLLLRLDNADGRYATAGQPGPRLALRAGSQVAIGLGARTSLGDEWVWTVPWWIDRLWYEDERGAGCLRLGCIDAWGQLERLRAPRQLTYPAGATIAEVLNRLLWRVTGVTLPAVGPLAAVLGGFAVPPGESYAAAVRRLSRLASASVRFGTDPAAPNGAGWTSVVPEVVPLAAGPIQAVYAVGGAAGEHPIARARHVLAGPAIGQVEVFGAGGLVGEAIDYAAIARRWQSWRVKIVDRGLASQADVDARAAGALAAGHLAEPGGIIEAPAHVGLEIGDVVALTDRSAGLVAARRTVVGLRTTVDRRAALRLDQRLELGGVG